MRRRQFIARLGSAAAWPFSARAQRAAVPVIGWLGGVPGTMEGFLPPFAQGLAETGYIVGRNVAIEAREGDEQPALAAYLIRQHVAVIATIGIRSAQVAKAATQTIPVVFAMAGDPVEFGVVSSLNRPSGNLTGVAVIGNEIAGKCFELMHKLVPAADPIAMLVRATGPFAEGETRAMQSAARALCLENQLPAASECGM
jgi:putative tryptophan/tyrosine transport system substrate-binding protein